MAAAEELVDNSFENYNDISKSYSAQRVHVGIDHFRRFFFGSNGAPSPEKLSLLDAGCGTGNYTHVACDTDRNMFY